VQASPSARDAGAPAFRILQVDASGNLTLNDTTITGGSLPSGGNGGGLSNDGTLTLSNSTVSGNSTGSNNAGGGIDNFGLATLSNSTVSGNTAGGGSGIANTYGGISTLTLNNSTVSGNSASSFSGGGISNGGTLTLERSLISGNTAPSGQEIYSFIVGCLSAASVNSPTCLVSTSTINSADSNLFGHSGLSTAQVFDGFTPAVDDIVATSDGTLPTALSAILDTNL